MSALHVLAAVDQFPQDEAVLARALELVRANDGVLTVVHAIDLALADSDMDRHDTVQGQAALAARDRIASVLTSLGAACGDVEIRIEAGSPALCLIEISEDLKPDLIVMRAHQRTRIADKILGSTTDRVVAAGRTPVLVVKRPATRPYRGVLVASDGKDDGSGALAYVANLVPQANLQLVQAVHMVPQLEEAMLRVGSDQGELNAHWDAMVDTAQTHLQSLSETAPRAVTTKVLRGEPSMALIWATRSPRADLITVGPGRTSLFKRAFIGSVTRRLLRDGASDVLIYR